MGIRVLLSYALCWLCFAAQSQAWGPAGHKIVASIAFRRLSPGDQAKVIALLKRHPRYDADFAVKIPAGMKERDSDEWIIQQASIWPDLTRGLPGHELRERYHHGTWHYINLPYFLSDADREALIGQIKKKNNLNFDTPSDPELQKSMNIIQAIAHSRSIVMDPHANLQDRALHVSWLIHLIGDLHQPLHSTALFSRRLFPDGDQGGNKIQTEQGQNLHILWDFFPGSPRFSTAQARAIEFLGNAEMCKLGALAAENQQVTSWLEESHLLAKTVAYDAEVMGFVRELEQSPADAELPRIKLSEAYLKQGGAVANRRLVQAGFRLGRILEAIP
jgi:hypothetical protein